MFFLNNSFWQKIIELDSKLFVIVNSQWTNPLFDEIAPFLRNPINWTPLYLFLIVFVTLNFKVKGVWWVIFFLVTIGIGDMTGNYAFKHVFERIRPCNNPELTEQLRLLVKCSSGFSFTSNHAINHFGMATFLFITFRHLLKQWMFLAFLWAGSIAYAQVYVGIHYPGDIIVGALVGIIYGIVTGTLFNKFFGLSYTGNSTT